jgi:regulator of protease activity HflC (stomatin/prohibitin superfamily)
MQVSARLRVRERTAATRAWLKRHELGLVITGLMLMLVLTFFWSNIVIAINPGEAGVLWSRLSGTKTDRVYPEGLHLILPWNVMTVYDVRYQTNERSFLVLSRDGLEIRVDVAVRFKPIEKLVPKLHQQVGPGYIDTIVAPEVNTAVRTVIGRFRPDELYAASFQEIQNDIVTLARRRVRSRFVLIDDILVKTIVLPAVVSAAIQRKLEQEQMALEMQYRLSRERQEADRKRVEAMGIRDYQETIAATLSPQLLQFKSIEAAYELAKSNNSKIVVLGNNNGNTPIILSPDVMAPAPSAPPALPVRPPGIVAPAVQPPVATTPIPSSVRPAAGTPGAPAGVQVPSPVAEHAVPRPGVHDAPAPVTAPESLVRP